MLKEINQSFITRIENNIVLWQAKKSKSLKEENSIIVQYILVI